MSENTRLPVSEHALIARINRRITNDDEVLRVSRSGRTEFEVGRYFTIDTRTGGVRFSNLDLEDFGREVGALRDYERLAD